MAKTAYIGSSVLTIKPAPADLNEINESGIYLVSSQPLNAPTDADFSCSIVEYMAIGRNGGIMRISNLQVSGQMFQRGRLLNGVWKTWFKISMTEV